MEKSTFTAAYKTLARLLRKTRENAGLTQVELAQRLNETQSEISKFERGERRLDLIQLRACCDALGTGLTRFVEQFDALTSKRRKL